MNGRTRLQGKKTVEGAARTELRANQWLVRQAQGGVKDSAAHDAAVAPVIGHGRQAWLEDILKQARDNNTSLNLNSTPSPGLKAVLWRGRIRRLIRTQQSQITTFTFRPLQNGSCKEERVLLLFSQQRDQNIYLYK